MRSVLVAAWCVFGVSTIHLNLLLRSAGSDRKLDITQRRLNSLLFRLQSICSVSSVLRLFRERLDKRYTPAPGRVSEHADEADDAS